MLHRRAKSGLGRPEGQNALKLQKGRGTAQRESPAQQEHVANDFGLLLDTIAVQRLARSNRVVIAAERVTHKHQPVFASLLRLPDMRCIVQK